jgi:cyclic-di-GMP-binding biofilm dispersal mediator protein
VTDAPVAAVVGATGGLGSAVARGLAAAGYRVVLAGRDPGRLAALAEQLGDATATTVALDVRDPDAGDDLVTAVTAGPGRLDVYVNAVGVVAFGDLVATDDVVVEELFLTNVVGPLWLLRRVVPLLETSAGVVVQLSAVLAESPLPGMAAYSASKAAVTAADRALTRELRRRRVRVVDVRPPHTETGLAERPLAGTAPRLPAGLAADTVAARIVQAVLDPSVSEIPSDAFGP